MKTDRPYCDIEFRSPLGLKAKPDRAARANARSLSTEVRFRLECSFREQKSIADTLALMFPKIGEGEIAVERIAAWLKEELERRPS
jgi:hypothetical protein